MTALLNVRFRILHLLASILTMIALYSINLRIMGRPEHRAAGRDHGADAVRGAGPAVACACGRCAAGGGRRSAPALLVRFLRSEVGLAMRATGVNPRMAEAQGIRGGRE